MSDCIVTKYPEIGYELREYSSYDGRGEGAADHGSAVFTLGGVRVDTSGAVGPASWLMARRVAATRAETTATTVAADALARVSAVERINAALETLDAEGCEVRAPFRALRVNKRGVIDYSGHCKLAGQVELARRAVALCAEFECQTALEDEVAAICGVLA